jgi:hypothetical protein
MWWLGQAFAGVQKNLTKIFENNFDIPWGMPQPRARSRPLLNLRRDVSNPGVDFLPLSLGSVAGDKGRVWLHGHLLGDESSAHVAQSVEHILGKDEVTGSNPVMGSPSRAWGNDLAVRERI